MIKITTRLFGELEVDEESVITFPEGLPGFEDCTRFKLLHSLPEPVPSPGSQQGRTRQVYWLQSLDDPDVSFSLVDPGQFGVTYQIVFSQEEIDLLKLDQATEEDLAVMVLLTRVSSLLVAENPFTNLFGSNVKPNLVGPILINSSSRLAKQKVLRDVSYNLNIHGT